MKRILLLTITIALGSGCTQRPAASGRTTHPIERAALSAANLRCEYLTNPLGIDEARPRLSWTLESDERGQRQTAYRILVASSRDRLAAGSGDLWDSGKMESDECVHVVYEGAPLLSRMQCFWKVMVWPGGGSPATWSEVAMWSMGLLQADEWKARWIGWDSDPEAAKQEAEPEVKTRPLEAATWIWYPVGSPAKSAPVGKYFFRHSFELPEGREVRAARIEFTADNLFTLYLNKKKIASGNRWQSTEAGEVSNYLTADTNTLAVEAANVGDEPNPAGLIGALVIRFKEGAPLNVCTDAKWKVSDEAGDAWPNPGADDAGWKNALALGEYGVAPWGKVGSGGRSAKKKQYLPAPHLRRDFNARGEIARATLYVTAQGFAEMHLNGQRVGDEYFTPGWTDYRKRIYYRTYDVTSILRSGANTVACILGDGWFRGNIWTAGQNQYGDKIRLLAQLQIDYADASSETIVSDSSWKAAYGPILASDMQDGETYDARNEMPGWDAPGFDDTTWAEVDVGSSISPVIQAYPGVPVRRTQEVGAHALTEPKPGVYVFDMGQNFSGWIRLKVKGEAGTKVVMRFAEMLKADGTVYTANLRSARATDTYVLKGTGEEVWEPRFTYHGFRYVEVSGLPGVARADMVTGIVIQSDAPMTSAFECSNPMLNKLHSNIVWGQRSNYLEVPTDCPQRDERLGWTGDTQVFIRTGAYNQDVAAFFTKWMIDLMDTQNGAGTFGNQAPVFHGHGSPAWADAGIICPWTIYKAYGDTRLIARHYDAMARFIDYCRGRGLKGPGDGYGDWLAVGSRTPKELISAAYFGRVTSLMVEMAEALGRKEEAAAYQKLFEDIRGEFQKSFVKADGKIAGHSQTAYCLALYYDLLTDAQRGRAAAHLVDRIKAKDYHLSVGFVGVPVLLPTLTAIGRSDLAYRLIQNKTYPSWGYSIEQGATTIWERWNSYTKDKGFGDAGMNSFNHYAYGACGEWMFRSMLGIDTLGAGFKTIVMKPELGEGITWARGHYDSIRGRIASDWRLDGQAFSWSIAVPPNTTARVYLPSRDRDEVTESGGPVAEAEGIEFVGIEDDRAVFSVESGTYTFECRVVGNAEDE